MSTKQIQVKIQLRRDLEASFEKIKNTFIPLKGEAVLVDTTSDGLRIKIGDGSSTFAALPYIDENLINKIQSTIVRGYYHNGNFYKDSAHTIVLQSSTYKLYIDVPTARIYSYDSSEGYVTVSGEVPHATDTIPGILKLYATKGNNTDGTMTQAAITNEVNKKFEVEAGEDETLNFVNYA